MNTRGAFTFVLHSHLPYARLAGRWPHGEEWIHEAASETYIPLLNALYDLREEGVPFRLTIGITPVLGEQLADPLVCEHLDEYLDDKIARAKQDILRFRGDLWAEELAKRAPKEVDIAEGKEPEPTLDRAEIEANLAESDAKQAKKAATKAEKAEKAGKAEKIADAKLSSTEKAAVIEDEASLTEVLEEDGVVEEKEPEKPWWVGDKHLEYLAQWYLDYYQKIKDTFTNRFSRDMIGAFKQLQDEGYLEIITCAATHGYLPLLGTDASIRAQLHTGVKSYERLFGRRPRAIWLPECAYRPAYYTADGVLRPGIEHFLAEEGIELFFSETHLITGGVPVGVAAADVIGPYGNIKRRYVLKMAEVPKHKNDTTTFDPYWVSDTTAGTDAETHSGVAVIGRNNETGQRVWSADLGYPGDFDYREFHRKDDVTGLQYWRVTGSKVDLGSKDFYHPDWAEGKMRGHAADFVALVERIHNARWDTGLGYGLIASNYDTELFGHWWFEGVDWLREVLRGLAHSESVDLTTAIEYIHAHPPKEIIHLPEGSWGAEGTHFTWQNDEVNWIWEPLHDAERTMVRLANQYKDQWEAENVRTVMNQIARELLLAESSDWPFLVTTGQAKDYSVERFSQHMERFRTLVTSMDNDIPDVLKAYEYFYLDNLFPNIDYRWWCE